MEHLNKIDKNQQSVFTKKKRKKNPQQGYTKKNKAKDTTICPIDDVQLPAHFFNFRLESTIRELRNTNQAYDMI